MKKSGAAWLVLSLGAVGLLCALYGFALESPDMHTRDPHLSEDARASRRTLVMAHRGGAGLWPENTAHAFAGAVALGVDVLEMDLHSTADGALVVIHDATVDRTTNGTGRVNALTLAELKRLDAGYRWTNDGGRTFPFRGKGITVPTLGEVLDEFPRVRLNIDIKQAQPSIVKSFCRALGESDAKAGGAGSAKAEGVGGAKAGGADGAKWRVTVASFSSQTLEEFRRECPAVGTSASPEEVLALSTELQAGRGAAADKARSPRLVQVPENLGGRGWLTPQLVAAAHAVGVEIHVWTVNDEAGMRRLLALGVDGIMTDYPDKLIALLKQTAAR